MKTRDRVTAYWIERKTGNVRSITMGPDDIYRGGLYENEVHIKHASDAIDVTIIPFGRESEAWAKDAIEQLKAKGLEMKKLIS